MTGLRAELLGTPRVTVDGAPLDVDTRKAVALLARLVVDGPQRRDILAALLWPDSDDARARAALRRTLSALRKGLDERWLDADRDEVRLDEEDVWSDVAAFVALRERTTAHDHDADAACRDCLEALEEAVALHRGEFLAGFHLRDSAPFDEWRSVESERFERQLREDLDRLIRVHTHLGDLDAAIAHARRRLELEPLHEPTHRRLMLLHAWRGQRGEAMRQYRDCVGILDRELGVTPLERTTELHEAIVAGRPPDRPSPAPTHRPQPPPETHRPTAPLVGREAELDQLRAAHRASGPSGQLVCVSGEAGIGKTRVIDAFLAEVRDAGVPTASVRCYEEEQGVAYAVAAEVLRAANATQRLAEVPASWLREAARLAPELIAQRPDLDADGPIDTPEARRRLLEGLRQVLAGTLGGSTPGVLVVDDVHWADEASQDALTYVLRRLEEVPICVVVAWRTELLHAEHPVRRVLAELARDERARHIRLGRLDRDHLDQLASDMGITPGPDLMARLAEESEGVPLLAVEHLHALADDGETDPWAIPAGIRELLERQVARLSGNAQQVLSAAAVIGRSFALDTLLDASGRDLEETVSALEELSASEIVAEIDGEGEPRYDFRHHRLREVVYEETSAARRRLLHGRVAAALESRRHRAGDARPSAGLVAHHLRAAGDDEGAARASVTAAEEALELSAHAEAIGHLQDALDLGHPDRGRIHEQLGDLKTLQGDYPGALHAYAAAAADFDEEADLARIEHRIANVHERRGDWASAEAHVDAGLAALPDDGPTPLRARLLTDRALVAHRRGEQERAEAAARRALELAVDVADDLVGAQALNLLGMLARSRGDLAEAVERLAEGLAVAEELDDPTPWIAALNNLALARANRGEHAHGLELLKTALGLCQRQGDRHREAAILNNLADLLHRAGQREEALDYIKRAVAIFAEIGEPEAHEPEIWKLVDW